MCVAGMRVNFRTVDVSDDFMSGGDYFNGYSSIYVVVLLKQVSLKYVNLVIRSNAINR